MEFNRETGGKTSMAVGLIAGVVLIGIGFGAGYAIRGQAPVSMAGETGNVDGANLAPLFKAWQLLDENFVPATTTATVTPQQKVYGMISGLAASYGDDYTVFFPPQEKKIFDSQVSGNFEGVGMEIDVKDGILTVVAPLKDTPAYRAGIKTGDRILEIDGQSTRGLTVDQAVKKIRGPKGTKVVVLVAREGKSAPFEVPLVRDTINLVTVETTARPDGVFVLKLHSFNALSPQKFREGVREFADSGDSKLILDLRGNPGGYLEAAVDIASWFLPVGKPVVEEIGNKNGGNVYRSYGYDVFTDRLRMAILIDGGSASASEILSGALHDYGKATLIGVKSFGKGSVQQTFDVTSDTSLKITVARWLTPNGVSISHQGIKPDIEVARTEDDMKANKDPQLDRAVEFLLTGK